MNKILSSEKKLASATKNNASKAVRANNNVTRSTKSLTRAMQSAKRASKDAFATTARGAKSAGRAITSLHNKTLLLGKRGFGSIGRGAGQLKKGVGVASSALAIFYGGAALAAGGLVGTASEFERFQTMLITSEGSAAGAQKAMSWITDFAAKTPYELQAVTDAFIALRAQGLDPTKGLMTSVGDASAAMGVPIRQTVEAVKDAVMGENERLKELGITAAIKGNEITYFYQIDGQEKIAKALKSDRAGIQAALEGIFNDRFAGSSERLSKTWEGMLSTISGIWAEFKVAIMSSGLFDWMKGKLSGVLDTINEMKANGDFDKWAAKIGAGIQTALEQAWAFGKGLVSVFSNIKQSLSGVAQFVGGWDKLALIFAALPAASMLASVASGIALIASGIVTLGIAVMANPISIAIAAVAASVFLIYKNWGAIKPFFLSIWNSIKAGAQTAWGWFKKIFSWSPIGLIVNVWGRISQWFSQLFDSIKNKISNSWEGIKTLFGWTPLGAIITNWNSITAWFGQFFGKVKNVISIGWENAKAIFSGKWKPDFSGFKLPELNIASIIKTWGKIKALFSWSPIAMLDKTFGGIADKIGGHIQKATDIAGAAWSNLTSVFSDNKAVDIAARNPASIERALTATNKLNNALIQTNNVDTSKASRSLSRLLSDAKGLVAALRRSIKTASSYLASVSFHKQGSRMMDTIAAGMKSRSHVVVNQMKASMQQVRDYLPSSPAKRGPLSDIHRLKFSETIARSIKSSPMVKAMSLATAATMSAAMPVSAMPDFASDRVSSGASSAYVSKSTSSASIIYSPTIHISGEATNSAKQSFEAQLKAHSREIERIVSEQTRLQNRKRH